MEQSGLLAATNGLSRALLYNHSRTFFRTSTDWNFMSTDDLQLLEFGDGLLAGLRFRGVTTLDERAPANLHEAFTKAFMVVEGQLGSTNLLFSITTDRFYGTSVDVFNILKHWRGLWATQDDPGTIWRLDMNDQTAEKILSKLPGDREMYLDAADAFLKQYRG